MKIITPVGAEEATLNIARVNSWLLVIFAATFMLSMALGGVLLTLILLLWLVEGRFAEKFHALRHNRFAWAAVLFVGLHLVGLLWTSDWESVDLVLKKEAKYLLLPVLMTVVRQEHIQYYLFALIGSMALLVGVSYGLYWDILPAYAAFKLEDAQDFTPLFSHIVYNPVLAMTLYILLYLVFFQKTLSPTFRVLGGVVFVWMGINMFLTQGRMGQLVFLVLLTLFVFQFYRNKLLKPALVALLLVTTIVPMAYVLSPVVQERVDMAIHEAQYYQQEPNSSVGLRVIMSLNALEIIRENPWFGVGTGDYKQEYAKVNQKNFPAADRGEVFYHPHNVYLLELVQLGVLGLGVLLYWFYVMLVMYQRSLSPLRPLMLGFPVFYAVIFFSDGYIMDHYLTFLFLLLGSILYTDYEPPPQMSA
ncbi:MAG: O-antigen ligase family protein [Candidatus Thiothrix sulfatifontis]|nr:MAG: O-antigen ligase family protein [Candidatus Thiothrix sulfatifontis]